MNSLWRFLPGTVQEFLFPNRTAVPPIPWGFHSRTAPGETGDPPADGRHPSARLSPDGITASRQRTLLPHLTRSFERMPGSDRGTDDGQHPQQGLWAAAAHRQDEEEQKRVITILHFIFHFLYSSFILDISIAPLQVHYYSEVLPTTALILCRSWHAEALQVTVSEGLAQGPYVADRAWFELAMLWTQGTEFTTELPHPTYYAINLNLKRDAFIRTEHPGSSDEAYAAGSDPQLLDCIPNM